MPGYRSVFAAFLWLAFAAACLAAGPGKNLVVNGSFDDERGDLFAWKYKYDLPGQSWYFKNHEYVSVVPKEGARVKVLAMRGTEEVLQVPGQGVLVESDPIAVKPNGRYRFTASARSTGPDCRIMVEGYKWKPGIKPHDSPKLEELRRCFRGKQIFFGGTQGGTSGGVGKNWERASVTFPQADESDLEKDMFNKAEFMVVHLVAIKGSDGYLYIDDVVLERLN